MLNLKNYVYASSLAIGVLFIGSVSVEAAVKVTCTGTVTAKVPDVNARKSAINKCEENVNTTHRILKFNTGVVLENDQRNINDRFQKCLEEIGFKGKADYFSSSQGDDYRDPVKNYTPKADEMKEATFSEGKTFMVSSVSGGKADFESLISEKYKETVVKQGGDVKSVKTKDINCNAVN